MFNCWADIPLAALYKALIMIVCSRENL